MHYILRGDNDYSNPIETVLKNRNITKDLFNLTENVIEDYSHYDNIQLGIDTLLEHINNNDKIAILVDVDCDGLSSAAILYMYIRDVFNYKNLYYILHTKKIHGLSKDIKIDKNTKLIFTPDSSSSDYTQHTYLKNKGIDIIVLDHHPTKYESKDAIVINNRLSKNVNNENFSGVGVTLKFLKALDEYLFQDKSNNYYDLVALGNIADMMDLKEEETRYYCYQGISNINNPFLKALIEKNSFQLENKYNINKIGWVIAPKLNGTIRSGTQQVKEDMFKAFITDDYNFCLKVADECKKAKDKQDRIVKNALPKIEKNIVIDEEDKCLILEISKTLQQEHIGLVANKLQEKYGIPVLLYKKTENEIVKGNARGNNNITNDFKSDLSNSGLCEFCEGQTNAFGWGIKKEKINKLKDYLNKLYKDKIIINGKTYKVDFILNQENFASNIIYELAPYEDEWGNELDEPLLVFENLSIVVEDDNIKGKNVRNLVFEVNGIKFIKKFLTNILRDTLLANKYNLINCIGRVSNNIYNGNSYPQVEILELEIIK